MSQRIKYTIYAVVILLLLLFVFILDLTSGYSKVSFRDLWNLVVAYDHVSSEIQTIILNFRLPKAITALMAGMGLSISGLLMQTLFRNPLASPYVLGISSGASLGVALFILGGQIFGITILNGTGGVIVSACMGAGFILLIALLIAQHVKSVTTLLIAGLMFSIFIGGLISLLQFMSDNISLKNFVVWGMGSLNAVTYEQLLLLVPIVLLGSIASLFFSHPLNVWLLGEQYAQSMGANIKTIKLLVVIIAGLLTGSITGFCGPIAFVGLSVPHIIKIIFNTSNHKILIPFTLVGGAIFMIFCDLIIQLLAASQILPINIISSIIGAPIVIWLLIRKKLV